MDESGLARTLEYGQSLCTLAMLRVPLWNYIGTLNYASTPWCLLGDFNCVFRLNEISGLGTVRTVGDTFTWTNKRPQNPVFNRLDRMLGNALWFQHFTEGCAQVKSRGIMDHNPIFYEEPIPIKNFKTALRDLNKSHGDLHLTVHTLRAQLNDIQLATVSDNGRDLVIQEQILVDKLNLDLLQEEHFLLQKSRVKWLGEGDKNNAFFHQQCKANWNHIKVQNLQNEEGVMVHGQQNCVEVVVSYFHKLMANADSQNANYVLDLSTI
ncbi:uncharacterized protein LOC141690451 [Apium graveolens]|uniref:uncharacterized protein LOC141690451 n=1 Tax=Apium graveolens TaxID=4045 RepID=UPI003D7C0026